MLVCNVDPHPVAEKLLGNHLHLPVAQEETLRNQISSWAILKTGLEVAGNPNVGSPPVLPPVVPAAFDEEEAVACDWHHAADCHTV